MESNNSPTSPPTLTTASSPVDAAPVAGNSQAIDQTPFPLHPYDSDNESERAGEEGPCSDSLAVLKLDANTTLLSEINRLRKAGTWCDVVLTSNDGVEFHAHKVVLSAFSTYLAALLSSSSGFREAIVMTSVTTNQPVVGDVLHLRLESLDSDLLRCIVDFAYGCDTTLPSARLPELLLAAHSFEMRRILLPTAELLSNVLDTQLCVRLLVECGPVLQDTGALWTAVSKYAAKRFGQLVVAPDFSRIPPSILMLLLLDDDLSGGISGSMVLEKGAIDRQLTEDQVMFALCKWSAARRDRGDSERHLDSLLPLIRFGLMSAIALAMLQSTPLSVLMADPGRCDTVLQSLLRSALQQHLDNRSPANRRSCYPMWRPGAGCGQYEGWLCYNWLARTEGGPMPIDVVPNEEAGYSFLVDWGEHRVLRIDELPPGSRRGRDSITVERSPAHPYPPSTRVIAGKGEKGRSRAAIVPCKAYDLAAAAAACVMALAQAAH